MKRPTQLKRTTPLRNTKPLVRQTEQKARAKVPVKRCKACRGAFTPASAWQSHCRSEPCAIAAAQAAQAKRQRQEAREARARQEAARPRMYWIKKAQAAVNRYVRARDHGKGCISCSLPAHWDGQWHASHFRSTGAASATRFHLWNIHKACSVCNNHKSGNLAQYRPRLIDLIGLQRVEWLEAQNQRADYPVDYLQRLAAVFNKKARRKEKRNALQG